MAELKRGTKVVLDYMDDIHAPTPGTTGEVVAVDSLGTIHVKWATGQLLGLTPEDSYHIAE